MREEFKKDFGGFWELSADIFLGFFIGSNFGGTPNQNLTISIVYIMLFIFAGKIRRMSTQNTK